MRLVLCPYCLPSFGDMTRIWLSSSTAHTMIGLVYFQVIFPPETGLASTALIPLLSVTGPIMSVMIELSGVALSTIDADNA